MTSYLLRRAVQMLVVVLLSATASYALLNMAPGGPLSGLRALAENPKFRLTAEDFARIRAYFEMDLNLPVRFTRWLVGVPTGPLRLGGQEFFGDVVVGCRKPIESQVRREDGGFESVVTGCAELVRLADLTGRRTSRGVLFGDFGLSWRLLRDRPVSDLVASRLLKTLELTGLATLLSLVIAIPLGVY
jgi:peptide/nickel transport system permease protein